MSKKDLETYYITWWVKKGEDEMFLKMSDFAKGLYSWRRYFKLSEQQVKKFVSCHQNQYKEIRFENILETNHRHLAHLIASKKGEVPHYTFV